MTDLSPKGTAQLMTADASTLSQEDLKLRLTMKAMLMLEKFRADSINNPQIFEDPTYHEVFLKTTEDLKKDTELLNDPEATRLADGIIEAAKKVMDTHIPKKQEDL